MGGGPREAGTRCRLRSPFCSPRLLPDDTPVAAAKNMPGDSADLFGDGAAEGGSAANGRLWRTVIIGEQEHRIDLHMIRPYMRVVTHGGEAAPPTPPGASCGPVSGLPEPQPLCPSHGDWSPVLRVGGWG